MQKVEAKSKRSRYIENMLIFSSKIKKKAKLRAFSHFENRRKLIVFNREGYCDQCKTVFEVMDFYY